MGRLLFALSSVRTDSRAHTGLWLFAISVVCSLSYIVGMLEFSDCMYYFAFSTVAFAFCSLVLLFGGVLGAIGGFISD